MPKKINSEILTKALKLLSGRLELERSPPVNLVVCGGAALIALELVVRTTKDVDVVALIDEEGILNGLQPLPLYLLKAAHQVAADLDLDENWLNSGPSGLVDLGLPPGFTARLHRKKYGNQVTVNFISRIDQIHFKLYAAVDSGPGYHVDDLLSLEPSMDEMGAAAAWAITHDVSPGFKLVLKDMLVKLGYELAAETI